MYEFKLPDLGEGIHEGEVLKWHVTEGGPIKEDDPLVDIETDKAAVTIPSPRGGIVVKLNGKVGDMVHTGSVITVIDDGKGVGAAAAAASTPVPKTVAEPQRKPESLHASMGNRVPSDVSALVPAGRKAIATPATRRIARERGIDINQVAGTGKGGRVTEEDLGAFAGGGGGNSRAAAASAHAPAAAAPAPGQPWNANYDDSPPPKYEGGNAGIPLLDVEGLPDFTRFGPVEKEALRSIRRKVARKMVTSMVLIPHVCHMDEADITVLEDLRKAERERLTKENHPAQKLTTLAFIIKAVVLGLKENRCYNASLDAVREEIVYKQYYNIGIAVDSGNGLVVPVLRNADQLSIQQISAAVYDLATRARQGKLDASEFQGGTFTITNQGALGGTNMIPCINYPESGILGVAKARDQVVVRDGKMVIRTILPLTLAFDHRIADGADAAKFVGGIVGRLSNPGRLMIEA